MQVIPVVSSIPIIAQINDTMSTETTVEVSKKLFMEMVKKIKDIDSLKGELEYLKSKIKAEHQETRARIEEEHKKTRAHIVTTNQERMKINEEEHKKTREEVKEAVAEVNGNLENKLDNLWDNHLSRINDMEENLTIAIKKLREYFYTAIDDRLNKCKRTFMSL